MIIGMFPLPKRNFTIGNAFRGYHDKNMLNGETVRSMISREIMDLPLFFYKILGQVGMFQCEWIVASPITLDIFNLQHHRDDIIIPISVKYRGLIQPKRTSKIQCQSTSGLFAKGIAYLLTQYPKTSSLDETKPYLPARDTSSSVFKSISTVGTLSGFLSTNIEKMYNVTIDGTRLTDLIYSNMLISSDASFATNIITSLADYCYNYDGFNEFDPKQFDIIAFVEDVINVVGEDVHKYLNDSFFVAPNDPITRIFLSNPGYTPIHRIFPYMSNDKNMFTGLYNLAMDIANSSAKFDGVYLPFWSNDHGGCEAFTLIDGINNSLTTEFGVMCSYSDTPDYACHDIFFPYQYNDHTDFYFKTLNVAAQDIFFDMSNNGVLAGITSIAISRNMLDEVFMVASGPFGDVCYYVPLWYYHLINPMIINMDKLW